MNDHESQGTDSGALREIEERVRARLAAVESENGRLHRHVRVLNLGLILTLAVVALVAVAPDTLAVVGLRQDENVVEARLFRLLDDNGLRRGEWSVGDDGSARLALLDQQGRPRLNVTVLESGFPGISFSNDQGQRRVVLGILPDQTTSLVFADAKGIPRAVVGLTRENAANLVFADANGVSRMGLGLDGSGTGSVMLPDADAQSTGGN